MKPGKEGHACPLCRQQETRFFWGDRQRDYHRCAICQLVFVPECFHLSADQERAVYDLHDNDPADEGYLRFLSRLTEPLLARLEPHSRGLDFGCGPGPALHRMLAGAGHRVDLYDPFYYQDRAIFDNRYDFICATEVVEHLRFPHDVFSSLFGMLRHDGWLAIMTKLVENREAFAKWHYIRDPTHLCFFSHASFAHLAEEYRATLEIIGKDVILLQKNRNLPS